MSMFSGATLFEGEMEALDSEFLGGLVKAWFQLPTTKHQKVRTWLGWPVAMRERAYRQAVDEGKSAPIQAALHRLQHPGLYSKVKPSDRTQTAITDFLADEDW